MGGFRLRERFNDGTEGDVDMAAFVYGPDAGVFSTLGYLKPVEFERQAQLSKLHVHQTGSRPVADLAGVERCGSGGRKRSRMAGCFQPNCPWRDATHPLTTSRAAAPAIRRRKRPAWKE